MKKTTIVAKSGQFVLLSLLVFFLTLIVVAVLMDPILEFVDLAVNSTSTSEHGDIIGILLNYVPLFVVIVLLASLFAIIAGR